MSNKNVWDRGRWSYVDIGKVPFDFMTNYIYEHLNSCVSFKDKMILELGSGTGRLSNLALKDRAKTVTLVDSSRKALLLSRQLFRKNTSNSYNIINSDVFSYTPRIKYDVVFSSGLIEHFSNQQRVEIIKKHIDLASHDCIIVHPTDTLYSKYFNRFPLSVKLYGFQKSFSEEELNNYLESFTDVDYYTHERFHPFYTVPLLHNNEKLNRFIDRSTFGKIRGGLTLTHIRVK